MDEFDEKKEMALILLEELERLANTAQDYDVQAHLRSIIQTLVLLPRPRQRSTFRQR